MINKLLLSILFLALLPVSASAATNDIESGWTAWFNSQKLDARWSLISDVQLRSDDGWNELQNLLVRPGLSYALNTDSAVAIGYAWIGTLNAPSGNLLEHRSWQQYVHTGTLPFAALNHRVRLEQRFVEPASGANRRFSQRLRYFVRSIVPVPLRKDGGGSFGHGAFLALQNELFLNIQHRDAVNDRYFDQNRAYLAAGYRLSPRWDVEIGYLHQYVQGRSSDTRNHVAQFALYTRF